MKATKPVALGQLTFQQNQEKKTEQPHFAHLLHVGTGRMTYLLFTDTNSGSGERLEPEEDRPCPRASSKYIS